MALGAGATSAPCSAVDALHIGEGATSVSISMKFQKTVNPKCRNEHGQGAINLAARNGQLATVLQWLHESLGLIALEQE